MQTPHIEQLRAELLGTLAELRNRQNPMEPERAKAIATVAAVLVDSARVEVEFLRVTKNDESQFLGSREKPEPPRTAWQNSPAIAQ